jgi:hypothetical protein
MDTILIVVHQKSVNELTFHFNSPAIMIYRISEINYLPKYLIYFNEYQGRYLIGSN